MGFSLFTDIGLQSPTMCREVSAVLCTLPLFHLLTKEESFFMNSLWWIRAWGDRPLEGVITPDHPRALTRSNNVTDKPPPTIFLATTGKDCRDSNGEEWLGKGVSALNADIQIFCCHSGIPYDVISLAFLFLLMFFMALWKILSLHHRTFSWGENT